MRYANRAAAGRELARHLARYEHHPDAVVLALPRGGVPVAGEIAAALQVLLDVFVVRKLGVPDHPEYAMGAIASGGVQVFNEQLARSLHISADNVGAVIRAEQRELARREALYHADSAPLQLAGRIAIAIDDGMATGSSMLVAVRALRQLRPVRIVVAVPAASVSACRLLQPEVDEVVCPFTPDSFESVGRWYADFEQVEDDEVRALLEQHRHGAIEPAGR